MSHLATLLAALVLGGSAAAVPHDPGLSSLQVTRDGSRFHVHVAFANADFRGATAFDRNRDGTLDELELTNARPALAELVRTQFLLLAPSGVGTPAELRAELLAAELAENNDIELSLAFARPDADAVLQVPFLRLLAHGHRCYAACLDDAGAVTGDALLSPRGFTFAIPAAPVATGFAQSGAFLALGIEHILIGFDHLAFLLALLVGCLSWRRIVATITAFTVAHSLTLLGAATGLVTLPSLLVEASIAASIVAVAVANLLQRGGAAHRWPWAFGFGLVHGFGFAGVLADLGIASAQSPGLAPLLAFNLGVEIGQLAFALAIVPLLRFAARRPRGARVAPAVSLAVGLLGCWWLGERLLA
jgi:hydrogenase/urease accessory protein HupE